MTTLLFHNFEVSQGVWNYLLKNYGLFVTPIFFSCAHAHKNLAANVIITQDWWIIEMAKTRKQGKDDSIKEFSIQFFFPCTHVHKNTSQLNVNITQDYWIRNMVSVYE